MDIATRGRERGWLEKFDSLFRSLNSDILNILKFLNKNKCRIRHYHMKGFTEV